MIAARWVVGVAGVVVCVASPWLVTSCASAGRALVPAPMIPGAEFVGNDACADCHGRILGLFPSSPHSRLHAEQDRMPGQSGCESCHGPASLHVASGTGGSARILNPGRDPSACLVCHLDTRAEFRLPYHHQVLEGRLNCVQCHDPHGAEMMKPAGGLAMARGNDTCTRCHREEAGPFAFEHEALRDGCTVCHAPHGSFNRKLLSEPDANLCLRCHAQVPGAPGTIVIGKIDHTALLQQGACWAAGCHSSIHGSNVDPRMRF